MFRVTTLIKCSRAEASLSGIPPSDTAVIDYSQFISPFLSCTYKAFTLNTELKCPQQF